MIRYLFNFMWNLADSRDISTAESKSSKLEGRGVQITYVEDSPTQRSPMLKIINFKDHISLKISYVEYCLCWRSHILKITSYKNIPCWISSTPKITCIKESLMIKICLWRKLYPMTNIIGNKNKLKDQQNLKLDLEIMSNLPREAYEQGWDKELAS